MTAIDANKARELLEAATPGPWRACGANGGKCRCGLVWSIPADDTICRVYADTSFEGGNGAFGEEERVANTALLVAAPDLARAVIALTEDCDRLRAALDGAGSPRASDYFEIERLEKERDAAIAERNQFQQLAAGHGFQHAMTALAAAQARIAAAEIYTTELESMLQRGCAVIWDLQVTKGTVDAWENAEREAEAWVEDVKRAVLAGGEKG